MLRGLVPFGRVEAGEPYFLPGHPYAVAVGDVSLAGNRAAGAPAAEGAAGPQHVHVAAGGMAAGAGHVNVAAGGPAAGAFPEQSFRENQDRREGDDGDDGNDFHYLHSGLLRIGRYMTILIPIYID